MTSVGIPSATLRWFGESPAARPVIMLLRHSIRPPIPDGETGNGLPLSEEGVRLAERLGALFGRRLSTIRTSPVRRCIETATALSRGAGVRADACADQLLGDPGVYVDDARLAWEESWRRMAHEEIFDAVVDGRKLPGFAEPGSAARRLLAHMVRLAAGPGVHAFVSHDSIVLPTAAHLLGRRLRKPDWPEYLESVVIWPEGATFAVRYRNYEGIIGEHA